MKGLNFSVFFLFLFISLNAQGEKEPKEVYENELYEKLSKDLPGYRKKIAKLPYEKHYSSNVYRFNFYERDPLRLCFIGDTGSLDSLEADARRRNFNLIKENGCNYVFFLGDLVYYVGINSLDDPELKDQFLNDFKLLGGLHSFLILGNHEYYTIDKLKLWRDVPKKFNIRNLFFPNYFYLIKFNLEKSEEFCVIALDTTPIGESWKEYTVRAIEQKNWLESKTLNDQLKNCTYTISIGHQGLFSTRRLPGSQLFLDFFQNILFPKIKIMIGSHDHHMALANKTPIYRVKERGQGYHNVTSVVVGSGGRLDGKSEKATAYQIEPGNEEYFKEQGFAILDWSPKLKKIEIKLINSYGKELTKREIPILPGL